ncbi:biotin-dependent carboxyltransferase family protein [Geodermatophilus nigrescens]|uniref:Biotin-dependent carboxylase uncharacterized domain-containing protein n=1 Tax=Geodermatophilus nigrescens TaxID=1070870 RepID=A0A1M5IQV3_9ACTN|nr:biotin-dependent carboxyltransferase family protein [Geodermatophilus nigrescens]SHG30606.1 biotin-dependent carboxylase uncharacterized domain-containing protein [Geodermatophilus nigrescens]
MLTVLAPGPLTTVQDRGRPGLAGIGVGRSGAADRAAAELANRLVGNAPGAAVLEATLGGLAVRADADLLVVTTGARCPGSPVHTAPGPLRAGATLALGTPPAGLRTYLAVRGGFAVAPVLGSRSTDVLAGLGPPVLRAGDVLPVGGDAGPFPAVDLAPGADPPGGEVTVRLLPGPRADWLTAAAREALAGPWTVTAESNRVGLRLTGPRLERAVDAELPSEGLVRGAVQVPPAGQPVLFLADAPVTGGYPVAGYVDDADVDRCAQLRPGQTLRLRR